MSKRKNYKLTVLSEGGVGITDMFQEREGFVELV